ncbi:MAG: hypothetical protein AAB514_03090 [Patescibacteria group bacterium]
MNLKKLLFISLTSITAGLLIAIIVTAFNNPTGNPTTGGGIIGVSSGATANSLYIDSTGKVGIGTASPEQKLHVYSSSASTGNITESQLATGYAYQAFKNPDGRMILGKEGSIGGGLLTGDLANAGIISTENNQPFQLGTNNTVRMTILGNGNVGIGKVPGSYILDVNGNVNATAYYGSGANLTNLPTAFGATVNKSASYGAQQAATDGFIEGYIYWAQSDAIGISYIVDVYTDSNANPSTQIQRALVFEPSDRIYVGEIRSATFSTSVKKGDYWKVVITNALGTISAFKVYWRPLGS